MTAPRAAQARRRRIAIAAKRAALANPKLRAAAIECWRPTTIAGRTVVVTRRSSRPDVPQTHRVTGVDDLGAGIYRVALTADELTGAGVRIRVGDFHLGLSPAETAPFVVVKVTVPPRSEMRLDALWRRLKGDRRC